MNHKIAGLILSAGQSKRMGMPKALLELPDGTTLLESQVKLLIDGGCPEIFVVIGADAEKIKTRCQNLSAQFIENKNWRLGQFSSLLAGIDSILKADATGIVLLPIDVAGVKPDTVRSLVNTTLAAPHLNAAIPEFEGKKGHPIFLSRKFCKKLAELDPSSPDARLDKQLAHDQEVAVLVVSDPNIIRNINTPDDWASYNKIKALSFERT